MFPLVDLVSTLGGLIIPPAFDFIKKKFVRSESDTPERTIGTLATSKPETLPEYVKALSTLLDSKVKFFNRDVIGTPSLWVIDLRAAIRPIGVILAFATLIVMVVLSVRGSLSSSETITGVRVTCEAMVSSWFGHRITLSGGNGR